MLQRLTAESFYQRTQYVCCDTVVIAGAGLKAEWEGAKGLDKDLQIGAFLQCGISICALHRILDMPAIGESGGVGHQLFYGYRIVRWHPLSIDQQ